MISLVFIHFGAHHPGDLIENSWWWRAKAELIPFISVEVSKFKARWKYLLFIYEKSIFWSLSYLQWLY